MSFVRLAYFLHTTTPAHSRFLMFEQHIAEFGVRVRMRLKSYHILLQSYKGRIMTSDNRHTYFDIPLDQQVKGHTKVIETTSARAAPVHECGFEGESDPRVPTKKSDPPRHLTLPGITGSGNRFGMKVRNESPWKTLTKIYDCDLADEVMVVVKKHKPNNVYLLQRFFEDRREEIYHRISSAQHINVAFARDFFTTTDSLFTLSDFVPLTLGHVVACRHYPDEQQLNAIMTQLLNGLGYIVSQNLQHTDLDCSGILMDTDGNIKIGRLHTCVLRARQESQRPEMQSVANIMMELLQKYVKDDGKIGIDDLSRWSSDSTPVDFLSATISVGTVEALMKATPPHQQN
ncbi:hypothetical protein PENSTE_c023G02063 [Penicillium steckii]|uniref:Protein kinase domain-containing protein n=1 Tax=Penicillium steckii TaxID=303698 RepID=A0A1V6SRF5_9EURO|nr:hypothetical protein PENSTE_c023G02063 [Penicillium steckii]